MYVDGRTVGVLKPIMQEEGEEIINEYFPN